MLELLLKTYTSWRKFLTNQRACYPQVTNHSRADSTAGKSKARWAVRILVVGGKSSFAVRLTGSRICFRAYINTRKSLFTLKKRLNNGYPFLSLELLVFFFVCVCAISPRTRMRSAGGGGRGRGKETFQVYHSGSRSFCNLNAHTTKIFKST